MCYCVFVTCVCLGAEDACAQQKHAAAQKVFDSVLCVCTCLFGDDVVRLHIPSKSSRLHRKYLIVCNAFFGDGDGRRRVLEENLVKTCFGEGCGKMYFL